MKIPRRKSVTLLRGVKRCVLFICLFIYWDALFHFLFSDILMGFLNFQEDDILREQIGLHGTEKYGFFFFVCVSKKNKKSLFLFDYEEKKLTLLHCVVVIHECSWAIIASKFKDKTTRQCRRRFVGLTMI
jgi:hypothetical protein